MLRKSNNNVIMKLSEESHTVLAMNCEIPCCVTNELLLDFLLFSTLYYKYFKIKSTIGLIQWFNIITNILYRSFSQTKRLR